VYSLPIYMSILIYKYLNRIPKKYPAVPAHIHPLAGTFSSGDDCSQPRGESNDGQGLSCPARLTYAAYLALGAML
jgi:hypothetical protein